MESVGLQEVNSKFIELSRDTNIDWTKIKEKIATFISLEDTQSKDKKQQPLVNYQQDINNSVNMSFIPANMYPNYYSGIIAAPGQQQIQLQQFAPSQGINNPPVVDINQPN